MLLLVAVEELRRAISGTCCFFFFLPSDKMQARLLAYREANARAISLASNHGKSIPNRPIPARSFRDESFHRVCIAPVDSVLSLPAVFFFFFKGDPNAEVCPLCSREFLPSSFLFIDTDTPCCCSKRIVRRPGAGGEGAAGPSVSAPRVQELPQLRRSQGRDSGAAEVKVKYGSAFSPSARPPCSPRPAPRRTNPPSQNMEIVWGCICAS